MAPEDRAVRERTAVPADVGSCRYCSADMAPGSRFCTSCGRGPDGQEAVIVIDDGGHADVVSRKALPPITPGPLPVDLVEAEKAKQDLGRRPALVVIGVSVLACIISAALLLLLRGGGGPGVDTDALLREGSQTFTSSVRELRGDKLLTEYDAATAAANDGYRSYADRIESLADEGDEELQRAAINVLRAERASLRQFRDQLRGLTVENLDSWPQRSAAISDSVDALEAAQANLVALEAEDVTARPNVELARTILGAIDERMAEKLDLYTRWQQTVTAERAANAGDLTDLDDYAGRTGQELVTYDGLREELSVWTNSNITAQSADQMLSTIDYHINAREGSQSRLANIAPLPQFSSLHGNLVSLIGRASLIVSNLRFAVLRVANLPLGNFTHPTDTPEWQEFREASDDITEEFSSLWGQWQGAVDGARSEIRSRQFTPQPEI